MIDDQRNNQSSPLQLIIATNRTLNLKKDRLQLGETLDAELSDGLHLLRCVFKAGGRQRRNRAKIDLPTSTTTNPGHTHASSSKGRRFGISSKATAKRLAGRIRSTVSGVRLESIPSAEQAKFLSGLSTANNGAPWLFFLHGNNQTLDDSVNVCRQLQQSYGVNVFLFSWPSRTYNPKSVPHLLASALMLAHPATRVAARATALKSVYDRHAQYKQARQLAEQSLPALRTALQLFTKSLMLPLQQMGVPVNLLVHSLGHYLLLLLASEKALQVTGQFGATMFHQADIDVEELEPLLAGLAFINSQQLFVTHNKKDYALFLSGLWNNRLNPNKAYTRLGNGLSNKTIVCGHVLDLTDRPGVAMNHAIVWQKKLTPEIKKRFKAILNFPS